MEKLADSHPLRQKSKTPPCGAFYFSDGDGWVRSHPGSTNSPGANSDSRRLALERLARKGESHGWDEQSHPSRNGIFGQCGAFCFSGGDGWVRTHPGSTNSPGANSDSRRLALERVARKGESHGWDEQSHPSRNEIVRQSVAFCLSEGGGWVRPHCLSLERARRKDQSVGQSPAMKRRFHIHLPRQTATPIKTGAAHAAPVSVRDQPKLRTDRYRSC